ncbi:MAG TPA: hypothetical protein VGG20_04710 [Thermoanaerobaculia bacterium]
MNRRKLSHVTAAGLLAALLMLPGPALAQSPHHRASVDLWSWLAGAWQRGMVSLGVGGLGEKQGLGIDPNGGKAGLGIDPNGSGSTGGTTMSSSPGDQGHGIDPNG